jgi:phosphoglycerol transferase MdoB-like AlkP superfamily enzyme
MLVFTGFRIVLYFAHYGYFRHMGLGLAALSFLDGLRFDLSILLTFISLPLFLMNLPVRSKWWMKILTVIAVIELLAMFLLLSGDLVYFGIVKRHIGDDLMLATNDMGFIIDYAIKQFWHALLLIAGAFAAFIFYLFRSINRRFQSCNISGRREVLIQIAVILLVIIGIRGSFGSKPLNVIHAFSAGSNEYGNLTLNGVFSSYHVGQNSGKENHNFYKSDDAIKMATSMIIERDEEQSEREYPLYRKSLAFSKRLEAGRRLNIAVFLLESWTPEYIDCFSHKGYGVTPNFDAIAAHGIKFTNAFANGDRSIYGITASLIGMPQIIGIPYLGSGLELINVPHIGQIVKNKGYRTIFAQASKKNSYYLNNIASDLGFEEIFGQQDYPSIYKYESDETPYFGWDYEALMFLEKKLSENNAPFFSYLFTGATHEPYILAGKKFEKYPHQRNAANGYLNALYYADWSIGQFFANAEKKRWFKDTVFIFLADHTARFTANNMYARFHIPIVIYAPGLLEPKETSIIAQQADIPATIIDLLNLKNSYTGIGKSLLKDYSNRFVISRYGDTMVYFNKSGYLQHNLKNVLDAGLKVPSVDASSSINSMKKEFLSVDQSLYELLKANRFYK